MYGVYNLRDREHFSCHMVKEQRTLIVYRV
jgi:hypothetical protein